MEEPRKFSRAANCSFVFIILLNAAFGLFGYLIYGDDIKEVALDSVTAEPWGTISKVSCLHIIAKKD